MGKLNDIKTANEDHPESEGQTDSLMKKLRGLETRETFSGQLLENLNVRAAKEEKACSLEAQTFGTNVFSYGDEKALLQLHIEGGLVHQYTPILDLRKAWWKEEFLDKAHKGKIENLGLIAPSVYDVIMALRSREAADEVSLPMLGATTKEAEYMEHDMYGTLQPNNMAPIMRLLENTWTSLIAPHFAVEFNNGNGDMIRKLRLVPKTQDARQALLGIGDQKIVQDALQKIVDSRDRVKSKIVAMNGETWEHKNKLTS